MPCHLGRLCTEIRRPARGDLPARASFRASLRATFSRPVRQIRRALARRGVVRAKVRRRELSRPACVATTIPWPHAGDYSRSLDVAGAADQRGLSARMGPSILTR